VVTVESHLVAAALDMLQGQEDDIVWTWEFDHAAWAEPIVDDEPG